jgi:hypothetical protein
VSHTIWLDGSAQKEPGAQRACALLPIGQKFPLLQATCANGVMHM